MSYSASGHHIVFELQQRSLTEKAACSHHRHTPPFTTNKSPSDESVGCGRNCLGACCLNGTLLKPKLRLFEYLIHLFTCSGARLPLYFDLTYEY
ncbi:hypothetical protein YC2023_075647 [Brassica napus]